MASSRLERIGTIYTRVRGLLKSGAMKEKDKPIWYEVYEAFPPKVEPVFGRSAPNIPVRQILYAEDVIRAKFYKRFGSQGTVSLFNSKPTRCQLFLNKYQEMAKDYSNEDDLFEAVCKIMEAENAEKTSSYIEQQEQQTKEINSSDSLASMFSSANNNASRKTTPSSRPKFNVGEILEEK